MSVKVSYSKQFVFGILLILVILVVIEGLVRIYLYEQPTCYITSSDSYENVDPDLKRQMCQDYSSVIFNPYPIPYLKPDQNFKTIHIDSDGFRGPEITKQKPENTYRIFVIGGSTVFGWGATSDESSIPGYLQEDFNKANLNFKVQVVNTGVPAALSLEEVEYVKNKLLDYHPDMLIVFEGFNDVAADENALKEEYGGFLSKSLTTYEKFFTFYKTPLIVYGTFNSITKIFFYKNLMINQHLGDNYVKVKTSHWKDRWKEICELGKKEGFDTLITVEPFLGVGNKTLTKYEYNNLIKMINPFWLSHYSKYVDALDELNNTCTKTADLRGVFDQTSGPIYLDFVHKNDKGNKIVADKLFELSLPIIKQKESLR